MSLCPCQAAEAQAVGRAQGGPDAAAIIAAAGSGTRFGHPGGKSLVPVAGRPLVAWSILAADAAPSIRAIIVVCPKAQRGEFLAMVEGLPTVTPVTVVDGGASRQESCYAGICAADPDIHYVAIHDGARPLVDPGAFEATLARIRSDSQVDGAVVGQPAVDTLKVVSDGVVVGTPERSRYWCVQTPQTFRRRIVKAAHETAQAMGYEGTDDASLVERAGGTVAVVPWDRGNIKVTAPEDLAPVEAALAERGEGEEL